MNIASIDIGSNTVLLLIAEVNKENKFTPLLNEYEMPRLSKGLKQNGRIDGEALEKFYKVMDNYSNLINKHNCDIVIATATNALRIASNSGEIIAEVKKRYGFDINTIPGEEEAELAYLGAASSLPRLSEKFVIDIGGGSTEIIYGRKNDILFKKSHPVGAVMLTEKFIETDPPEPKEIKTINEYLEKIFNELKNNIPQSATGIAVAGTPTSLAAMILGIKEYEENKIEGYFFTKTDLDKIIEVLSGMKSQEILEKFGPVVKGREDVITAGALILKTTAEILNVEGFTVSGRGIRYGALIKYLENNQ